MPLSPLITQYIVRTEEKVNKSNLKVFCKPCIEDLGEEEECKISFSNKADHMNLIEILMRMIALH